MLRWLPKKLTKRTRFVLRLALFACCWHVFFLGIYFFASLAEPLTIEMDASLMRSDIPIRVVPFMRAGQLKAMQHVQRQKQEMRTASHGNRDTKTVEKQQIAAKKLATKSATRLVKQAVPAKNKQKAPVQAKEREQKRNVTTAKNSPVETNHKEKLVEVSRETVSLSKKDEAREPVKTAVDDHSKGDVGGQIQELVVGRNEYEMIKVYQEIQEELAAYWRPPAGMKPKQSAILLALIGDNGRVGQVQVEQSSGVLAYDMAARMALVKSSFSLDVRGRQLRLHF
jgi:outer membrane biosynthesis protein TonB